MQLEFCDIWFIIFANLLAVLLYVDIYMDLK